MQMLSRMKQVRSRPVLGIRAVMVSVGLSCTVMALGTERGQYAVGLALSKTPAPRLGSSVHRPPHQTLTTTILTKDAELTRDAYKSHQSV